MQRRVFRIERMLRPRATARTADMLADLPMSRTLAELSAVVAESGIATHTILQHLEKIDEAIRALEAGDAGALTAMRRSVTAIYEACHFHDTVGQRVGKAIAAIERGSAAPRDALINGPKLDSDDGHVAQADIDRMFR